MQVLTRSVRASRSSLFEGFVCSSCRNQLRRLWQPPKGKDLRSVYAKKVRDAEAEWQIKAEEIAAGKRESMLSLLESRGYINTIAGYVGNKSSLSLCCC